MYFSLTSTLQPWAVSEFAILFFLKNINTPDNECSPTCPSFNSASRPIDRSKLPVARNSGSEANTLVILTVRTSFVARKHWISLAFLAKLPKTSNLFQAPCWARMSCRVLETSLFIMEMFCSLQGQIGPCHLRTWRHLVKFSLHVVLYFYTHGDTGVDILLCA